METWEAAWALKVMGYIHLTQLYLGMMKARGQGAIVNIIGAAGRSPRYNYVCGATGNAALMAFTGAVGGKSSEWGVRVFGINPSQTRTDRIISLSKTKAKDAFGDENRWQEMLKACLSIALSTRGNARTAAFLASPACGYVSGAVLDVDGGQAFRAEMAIVPGWQGRFFEDFVIGDVYKHPLGRTVTATDNAWFTNLTLNTAHLHFDANYASQTAFGKPLVNSCFTLALVTGQSSRIFRRMSSPISAGTRCACRARFSRATRSMPNPKCWRCAIPPRGRIPAS